MARAPSFVRHWRLPLVRSEPHSKVIISCSEIARTGPSGLVRSRSHTCDRRIFSFAEDDEKGSQGSAGGFYQRDVRVVRNAADRARSVEFTDLGSGGITRSDGYHRLVRLRSEDFEAAGAFEHYRCTEPDRGGRVSMAIASFGERRYDAAVFGVNKLCPALELGRLFLSPRSGLQEHSQFGAIRENHL